MTVPAAKISEFDAQGFTVAKGLFSPDEVAQLREHYFWINREHRRIEDNVVDQNDPLASYPRVMLPHRWDETSLQWMIDARLNAWLTSILRREPFAVQTMFYFKPPGARGPSLASGSVLFARRPGHLRRRLDGD